MLKLDRLSAFSDGVMSIAITLLVFTLQVPSAHKVPDKELGEYLFDTVHILVGYLSSFFMIGPVV